MAKRRLELTRAQVPCVSTTLRWPRRAAPGGSELAESCGMGRAAGQHAAGGAALDPCSCRGDRARQPGRTRRWCSCGGHGSARTSSPNATERCSPLGGCRRILAARRDAEQLADRLEAFLDGRRMSCRRGGTRTRQAPGFAALCRADRPSGDAMGWRATADDLDGAASDPRSGRRSTRARRVGTSTSSDRRPRRRSPSGPGSRQRVVGPHSTRWRDR